MDCGCKIAWKKEVPRHEGLSEAKIEFCPLHAHARELLDAAKEMRDVAAVLMQLTAAQGVAADMEMLFTLADIKEGFGVRAQDAIAKAEGRKA